MTALRAFSFCCHGTSHIVLCYQVSILSVHTDLQGRILWYFNIISHKLWYTHMQHYLAVYAGYEKSEDNHDSS